MFSLRFTLKSTVIKILALLFVVQALGVLPSSLSTKANAANCSTINLTIERRSNAVFYFDKGTSITSNYVQFHISTASATTGTAGYYAKIENITSSKLALAQYEVAAHPFRTEVTSTNSLDLYWYLTATDTDVTFNLDLAIYNGDPSGVGIEQCRLTQAFTKIDSTIAASANKVTSVVYSAVPAANADGSQTFTATVKGQTGTIGAGPSASRDVNLSPSTASAFDAKRFRLSSTEYKCGGTTVTNYLFIQNACSGLYTAIFTFQHLAAATSGATAALSPIMQIASGTQMKHTSAPSFTIAEIGAAQTPTVTTNAATNIGQTPQTSPTASTATLNGTIDYGTFTGFYFCYLIKNSGPAPTSFSNACNGAGEIKVNVTPPGEFANSDLTGLTPGSRYFFELIGVYNTGFAHGGIQFFTATPFDTTGNAGNIAQTTSTLNGTQAGIAADSVDLANSYFYYGTTDPATNTPANHMNQAVDSKVAVTAATTSNLSFSANITGLTANTLYYFEIVISDSSGSSYLGGVKTFSTLAAGALVKYTVSYDANGGTGTAPNSATQVNAGDPITVAGKNDLTYSGFSFGGWNRADDGTGTNYEISDPITPLADLTLYVKWNPNKYQYNANTGTGGPTNQVYAGTTLQAVTNTFTAPAGYIFDGWCTAQLTVGTTTCNAGNAKYSETSNLPNPESPTIVLYAIWKTAPVAPPAPVYIPTPPTITSISAPEVCAISSQLVVKGTFLNNASATLDGVSATVLSSNYDQLVLQLPSAPVGTKSLVVRNPDGTANTTIKYRFVDTAVYVNYIYPSTYEGIAFGYTFKATNTEKYSISGVMPAGLTLNALTGEISGTPTEHGNFKFTIVASNVCDQTYLDVYMFVDKAIPETFTCTVSFPVPKSDTVSEYKLSQLRKCLEVIYKISPETIAPVIFISGGLPSGLSVFDSLTHPRYLPILDLITSMKFGAQIYLGAFSGSTDTVQLNVYWQQP